LKEANQFIRREDWPAALPLLQKALARNPHRYEIAYRWVQAVRQTGDDDDAARAVNKILARQQWSATEQEMLRQLRRAAVPQK